MKIKIIILSLLVFVSALALPVSQAHAFGIGVPNSINWDDFFTRLAESTASTVLKGVTDRFVSNAVGKLLSTYKIGNYRAYAISLGKQAYTASQIQNDDLRSQYLTNALITDTVSSVQSNVNLDPLYTQAALQSYDIYNVNKYQPGTPQFYAFLADASAPSGSPVMQKVIAQDHATTVHANAQQAANLDILSSNGSKSSYNCSLPGSANPKSNPAAGLSLNSLGSGNTSTQIAAADCLIQDPAGFVNSDINNEINSAFNVENKPDDFTQSLADALSKTLSSILLNKVINPSLSTSIFGNGGPSVAGTAGTGNPLTIQGAVSQNDNVELQALINGQDAATVTGYTSWTWTSNGQNIGNTADLPETSMDDNAAGTHNDKVVLIGKGPGQTLTATATVTVVFDAAGDATSVTVH